MSVFLNTVVPLVSYTSDLDSRPVSSLWRNPVRPEARWYLTSRAVLNTAVEIMLGKRFESVLIVVNVVNFYLCPAFTGNCIARNIVRD